MRTNYVLIDYENVQPEVLSALDAQHFKVVVFVGASQNKLSFDTADALQKMGGRAEYVKIAGNGANALDFHIAFYIGRISFQDPAACFHIVSKDTGFDPLVQHLKKQMISAVRCSAVSDIPLLKVASGKTIPEKLNAVVANLAQRGASKPGTLKALKGTIYSLFS
ncbi:MAG: PIN domain-containing protein [Planctomyces sp.]